MNKPLHEEFGRYNGLRRRFFRRRGLAAAVVTLLVAVLIVAGLDVAMILSSEVRLLAIIGIVVGAFAVLARWWWQPAGQLNETNAATEIERHFPDLGQLLRTAREAEEGSGDLAGANPALVAAMQKHQP